MGIFGKVECKVVKLPFYYVKEKEDIEAGGISIEAKGVVEGVDTYFYTSCILSDTDMYEDGSYEEMSRKIESIQNISVNVSLKYRRNKLVGFEIDKLSLCKSLGDKRFEKVEFIFQSIGEKSRMVKG